jgi:hypothetical protein
VTNLIRGSHFAITNKVFAKFVMVSLLLASSAAERECVVLCVCREKEPKINKKEPQDWTIHGHKPETSTYMQRNRRKQARKKK